MPCHARSRHRSSWYDSYWDTEVGPSSPWHDPRDAVTPRPVTARRVAHVSASTAAHHRPRPPAVVVRGHGNTAALHRPHLQYLNQIWEQTSFNLSSFFNKKKTKHIQMHACIRKYVKEKCGKDPSLKCGKDPSFKCGKDPSLSQILLLVICIILFITIWIKYCYLYLLRTVFHFPVSVK